MSNTTTEETLADLIKNAMNEFRKDVLEQQKSMETTQPTPEQLEKLLSDTAEKEAEYLAGAINRYLTRNVFSKIAKLEIQVNKLIRGAD